MFAEFFQNYGVAIVGAIATGVFAYLGTVARRIAERYINTAEKKKIARDVVRFAEQVYKDCEGSEKLDKALTAAREMLAEQGIAFNELEMRVLIESCVRDLKEEILWWEGENEEKSENAS